MVPDLNSQWFRESLGSEGRHRGRARQSAVALVAMLLIAAAGAILSWSWWLEYSLIAPSAVWLIVSGRLVVYRQLGSGSSDRRVPVVLVVPVLLAATIQPTRYSGLVVVAAFAVLFAFGRHRESHTPSTITAP
jgi:hypothetical protein